MSDTEAFMGELLALCRKHQVQLHPHWDEQILVFIGDDDVAGLERVDLNGVWWHDKGYEAFGLDDTGGKWTWSRQDQRYVKD